MSTSLLVSILTERGIVSVQATDTASDGASSYLLLATGTARASKYYRCKQPVQPRERSN